MGNVKDRYFKHADTRDQYVGHCLTLTPILQESLASSPPFFGSPQNEVLEQWICSNCLRKFGALYSVIGFGKLI
jgi:hypothetical protein